jgi:hypothetical protein
MTKSKPHPAAVDAVRQNELCCCPHCGWAGMVDETECLLAEEGAVFCPDCGDEFEPISGQPVEGDLSEFYGPEKGRLF